MNLKYLVIGIMMLFCLNVFGQQKKTIPMTVQPQKTEVQVLEETVLQLQTENQAMHKRLESIEKEIELCRNDVREKNSEMNTNMVHWFSYLTIVMAILGVAIPLILNKKNERIVEKLLADARQEAFSAKNQAEKAEKALNCILPQVDAVKEQVESATTRASLAKQAVADIEKLKTHVDEIEKKINEDARAAENAAKESQANQLFTQALSEKKTSKGIELYSEAITMKPDFVEAYFNRGLLKFQVGDAEGALSDFDKTIELDPNDAEAYCIRGYVKSEIGDNESALSDCDKAIVLRPDYAEAYSTRSIPRSNLGDHKGALADCEKALILSPDDVGLYVNRGYAFLKAGEYDKALEDTNMAIEKGERSEFDYDTRGQVYLAMGETGKALDDFDKALSINTRFTRALKNRAKCYRKIAETEQDPVKQTEWIAKAETDEQKARRKNNQS